MENSWTIGMTSWNIHTGPQTIGIQSSKLAK